MPIIFFLLSFFTIHASADEGLSCLGTPKVYDLEHTSEIFFVKSALPEESKRQALFSTAIIYQNLFPFTEMPRLQRPIPTLRWGGFEATKARVEVLKAEDATYPFRAEFTGEAPTYYAPVVNAYLAQVAKLKQIKAGIPAVKVTYRFKVPVELCQLKEEQLGYLNWPLPKDPYLAYFVVPEKDRVRLRHPIRGEGMVNPCSSVEEISYGGHVEPFGFWYFWSPWGKGTSLDGKAYDCTTFMKEGEHWVDVKPKLQLKQTVALEPRLPLLKEKSTPLKLTFLFGGMQYAIYKSYDEKEQADIRQLIKDYLKPMEFGLARSKLPAQQGKYDPAVSALLVFIWNLERNSLFKNYSLKVDATTIQLYLKGIFKLSRKPFELRLHLSPNQPDQPGHESFNNLMAHALVNDDVVVYSGHSGWGKFLGPGLERAKQRLSEAKTPPSYQIVAIFSCAATLHYPLSKFPSPHTPGFKRDFIQSVGSFADGSNVGATTIVGIIDQSLYQDRWPAFKDWVKAAKFDNFLKYIPAEQRP